MANNTSEKSISLDRDGGEAGFSFNIKDNKENFCPELKRQQLLPKVTLRNGSQMPVIGLGESWSDLYLFFILIPHSVCFRNLSHWWLFSFICCVCVERVWL